MRSILNTMADKVTHEERTALKEICERAVREQPWAGVTGRITTHFLANDPGGTREHAKVFALLFIDAMIDRFLELRTEIEKEVMTNP